MGWNFELSYLITEILNPTPTVDYGKYPRSSGVLDTSISQARMLGITQNLNKLVKVTIGYDDSKFKAFMCTFNSCQRILSHVLNRGRLTFSGKLFSSTNVILPSCDLSIKLNNLNHPQKRAKLSVKSKVININNVCLLLHPNFYVIKYMDVQ